MPHRKGASGGRGAARKKVSTSPLRNIPSPTAASVAPLYRPEINIGNVKDDAYSAHFTSVTPIGRGTRDRFSMTVNVLSFRGACTSDTQAKGARREERVQCRDECSVSSEHEHAGLLLDPRRPARRASRSVLAFPSLLVSLWRCL